MVARLKRGVGRDIEPPGGTLSFQNPVVLFLEKVVERLNGLVSRAA